MEEAEVFYEVAINVVSLDDDGLALHSVDVPRQIAELPKWIRPIERGLLEFQMREQWFSTLKRDYL